MSSQVTGRQVMNMGDTTRRKIAPESDQNLDKNGSILSITHYNPIMVLLFLFPLWSQETLQTLIHLESHPLLSLPRSLSREPPRSKAVQQHCSKRLRAGYLCAVLGVKARNHVSMGTYYYLYIYIFINNGFSNYLLIMTVPCFQPLTCRSFLFLVFSPLFPISILFF